MRRLLIVLAVVAACRDDGPPSPFGPPLFGAMDVWTAVRAGTACTGARPLERGWEVRHMPPSQLWTYGGAVLTCDRGVMAPKLIVQVSNCGGRIFGLWIRASDVSTLLEGLDDVAKFLPDGMPAQLRPQLPRDVLDEHFLHDRLPPHDIALPAPAGAHATLRSNYDDDRARFVYELVWGLDRDPCSLPR